MMRLTLVGFADDVIIILISSFIIGAKLLAF
jgi:hypothetical protein